MELEYLKIILIVAEPIYRCFLKFISSIANLCTNFVLWFLNIHVAACGRTDFLPFPKKLEICSLLKRQEKKVLTGKRKQLQGN